MIQGTTYYKITLEEAIDAYKDENSIVFGALTLYGWEAIDVHRYLIGSDIVDDVLYLCVTDGIDIEIDDDWSETGLIDPEEALAAVGPEVLQNYIEPATSEVILKHLTPYDLADNIDLDEIALRLLEDGYTFNTIVSAATDAQLIEI